MGWKFVGLQVFNPYSSKTMLWKGNSVIKIFMTELQKDKLNPVHAKDNLCIGNLGKNYVSSETRIIFE